MSELELKSLRDRRHFLLNSKGRRRWKNVAIEMMDKYQTTLEHLIACKNELKLHGKVV